MIEVESTTLVRAPLWDVFSACWTVENWPLLAGPVKAIEIVASGPRDQHFRMTVESLGRHHLVESVRSAVPPHRIAYRQVSPPIFLSEHTGEWALDQQADGIAVRLVHRALINGAAAMRDLGVASIEVAAERISTALRANGEATINAIKCGLEQESPREEER